MIDMQSVPIVNDCYCYDNNVYLNLFGSWNYIYYLY